MEKSSDPSLLLSKGRLALEIQRSAHNVRDPLAIVDMWSSAKELHEDAMDRYIEIAGDPDDPERLRAIESIGIIALEIASLYEQEGSYQLAIGMLLTAHHIPLTREAARERLMRYELR